MAGEKTETPSLLSRYLMSFRNWLRGGGFVLNQIPRTLPSMTRRHFWARPLPMRTFWVSDSGLGLPPLCWPGFFFAALPLLRLELRSPLLVLAFWCLLMSTG